MGKYGMVGRVCYGRRTVACWEKCGMLKEVW